jgi:CRISPR-associated protein Csx10
MNRAITYTLTLEEACLFAAPGGDPNTETTLNHVPGSALRGAFAAAYLHGEANDNQFNDLFLNGRVRYLNAYPYYGQRTLPARLSWARRKDISTAGGSADDEKLVYDRTNPDQQKTVDEGIPKGVGEKFVTMSNGTFKEIKIAYELGIHTARNRGKGRSIEGDPDSALFRYQALARDQVFGGVILVDDAVSDQDFKRLENLVQGTITLGGSHMAAYGRARVSPIQKPTAWRETDGAPPVIKKDESFIVYLAAPAILYDPMTGQPASDIRLFLPGDKDDYVVEQSFASAGWVGGFNKQRGLPLTQEWAMKMGSTWLLKAKRDITADAITDLEWRGIGARTAEGFGQVILAPPWTHRPFELEGIDLLSAGQAADQSGKAGHELLEQMNERIARRELDQRLAAKVNELAPTARGNLSRSQLGRIQIRIRREVGKDNFQDFINYLEGTTKRKSADDQFRKYRVDGKNFRDYLKKLAGSPATVWEKIGVENWQPPQIGPEAYDFRQKLAHEYTVKFISKLCRQLAKQRQRAEQEVKS